LFAHGAVGSLLTHEQHRTRALDGSGQLALVLGAIARMSSRQNPAAFGHELLQQIRLLEINDDLVDAQLAVALDDHIALRSSAFPAFAISFSFSFNHMPLFLNY
jgi:hypothetical protein